MGDRILQRVWYSVSYYASNASTLTRRNPNLSRSPGVSPERQIERKARYWPAWSTLPPRVNHTKTGRRGAYLTVTPLWVMDRPGEMHGGLPKGRLNHRQARSDDGFFLSYIFLIIADRSRPLIPETGAVYHQNPGKPCFSRRQMLRVQMARAWRVCYLNSMVAAPFHSGFISEGQTSW